MATALKSLTFTTLPKAGANPVLNRRTTILARLEEQKLLLNDPSYVRVSQRWTKKDGERVTVEKRQRVSPWWRLDPSGSYLFFIRSGEVEDRDQHFKALRSAGVGRQYRR